MPSWSLKLGLLAVFCSLQLVVFAEPGKNAKAQVKSAPIVTFAEVSEVFDSACIDCHNSDIASGGLDMSSYRALLAGGASGAVIEAQNSASSKLFLLANHSARPFMPPKSSKIDKKALKIIKTWIDQGARFDKNSPVTKKKQVKSASVTLPKLDGPAVLLPPMPKFRDKRVIRPFAVLSLSHSPVIDQFVSSQFGQSFVVDSRAPLIRGSLAFDFGQVVVTKFSRRGDAILAAGGIAAKLGRAVLWNVKTGRVICTLGTERDTIIAADVREDLAMIALGGTNKKLRVYATKNQSRLYEIGKHTNWVTANEFSPDGVLLASADRNGALYLWESENGREFAELKGHTAAITALSWRLDSNLLASCAEDGQIILWRAGDGANIRRWAAHPKGVTAIAFSFSGKIVSVGRDLRAKVWDQNGKLVQQSAVLPALPTAVSWRHDSKSILIGLIDGSISNWNPKKKQIKAHLVNAIPKSRSVRSFIGLSKKRLKAEAVQTSKLDSSLRAKLNALKQESPKIVAVINSRKGQLKSLKSQLRSNEKASLELRTEIRDVQELLDWNRPKDSIEQEIAELGKVHCQLFYSSLAELRKDCKKSQSHARIQLKNLADSRVKLKVAAKENRKALTAIQSKGKELQKRRKALEKKLSQNSEKVKNDGLQGQSLRLLATIIDKELLLNQVGEALQTARREVLEAKQAKKAAETLIKMVEKQFESLSQQQRSVSARLKELKLKKVTVSQSLQEHQGLFPTELLALKTVKKRLENSRAVMLAARSTLQAELKELAQDKVPNSVKRRSVRVEKYWQLASRLNFVVRDDEKLLAELVEQFEQPFLKNQQLEKQLKAIFTDLNSSEALLKKVNSEYESVNDKILEQIDIVQDKEVKLDQARKARKLRSRDFSKVQKDLSQLYEEYVRLYQSFTKK